MAEAFLDSKPYSQQAKVIEPSAWYFPFLLILLAPSLLRVIVAKSPADTIGLGVQLLVLGALLYTFAWRRWLVVGLAISAAFAAVDALYYFEYRESLSVRAIAIALQTPLEQTVSFISARVWSLLFAMVTCTLVCVQVCRAPSPTQRRGRGSRVVRAIASVLSLLFFALALFAFSTKAGVSALIAGKFTVFAASNVANSYPYKPIQSTLSYFVSDKKFDELQNRKLALDLTDKISLIEPNKTDTTVEAVVLVLGESSNKSRWSLYGYGRQTNPKLSQRSGLILLQDLVSPWNSTMASVPVIMTQKSPTDKELYTDQPGLAKIMQTAGIDTYWLSNQGTNGNFDRSIKQLYVEAKHQEFVSGQTALLIGQPGDDAKLIEPLKRALSSSAKKLFIVLHTQGSHYPFWERYPLTFEVFRPAKRGEEFFNNRLKTSDWLNVSNSYDNSILYTDFVLDQIIELLEQSGRSARLVYVSDHGQAIPTATCSELGQGYTSNDNLRVPGFIWLSKSYRASNPQHTETIARNAKIPQSTSNIFPSVLSLAGIRLQGVPEDSSLLSKTFKPGPQLVNTETGHQLITSLTTDPNCK
jgi:glucan phosphoethanolaminetransferase (alkaline phosphatase superfamily)